MRVSVPATRLCLPLAQFLGVSVLVFRGGLPRLKGAVRSPKATAAAAAARTSVWIPILMMYVPVHLFFFALAVTFVALPPIVGSAIWAGGTLIYYGSTMFGEPEHNGALHVALDGFLGSCMELQLLFFNPWRRCSADNCLRNLWLLLSVTFRLSCTPGACSWSGCDAAMLTCLLGPACV